MLKRRIFIAIQIPEKLKIIAEKHLIKFSSLICRGKLMRKIRFLPKENWHITVAFLGYLSEKEIEALKHLLNEETAQTAPFELRPEKIILAPPGSAKRMIWLKFEKSAPFEKLKNGIENKIVSRRKQRFFQNFRPEQREHHIHITLARLNFAKHNFDGSKPRLFQNIKNLIPAEEIRLKKEDGAFIVKNLDIMESRLSRTGAEYGKIFRSDLRLQKKIAVVGNRIN